MLVEELVAITVLEQYLPQQIFNVDKTRFFFYKRLPEYTHIHVAANSVSDFKDFEDFLH